MQTNAMNFKTLAFYLTISCCISNPFFAQQLDPIHYPPESEWEYLKTKNTDSLIQVMKYYFLSNDTLFYREARSQLVVKTSLKDLQRPTFYLGQDYAFANRFYGPDGATASRTSKNEKLDRFYYYYLNSPELKFNKEAPKSEPKAQEIELVDTTKERSGPPAVEDFIQKSSPNSALRPQIVLKNGGILYPEQFYFLSDGQLYFGNGIRENVFKVDTIAVAAVIGIEVGENLDLNSKVGYAFGGRCMRFTGIFIGIINTAIVSFALSWEFDNGMAFFGTIPTGIIYIKLIINGTKRIENKKRYKRARYVR